MFCDRKRKHCKEHLERIAKKQCTRSNSETNKDATSVVIPEEDPINSDGYGKNVPKVPFKNFETVYEDRGLQLRVRNERFLQPKKFNISDLKFEITATTSPSLKNPLVLNHLGAFHNAIDEVVKTLKRYFHNENRRFILTFHHNGKIIIAV